MTTMTVERSVGRRSLDTANSLGILAETRSCVRAEILTAVAVFDRVLCLRFSDTKGDIYLLTQDDRGDTIV